MTLTLSPNEDGEQSNRIVSIVENCEDVFEVVKLMADALIAFGYNPETVVEAFAAYGEDEPPLEIRAE